MVSSNGNAFYKKKLRRIFGKLDDDWHKLSDVGNILRYEGVPYYNYGTLREFLMEFPGLFLFSDDGNWVYFKRLVSRGGANRRKKRIDCRHNKFTTLRDEGFIISDHDIAYMASYYHLNVVGDLRLMLDCRLNEEGWPVRYSTWYSYAGFDTGLEDNRFGEIKCRRILILFNREYNRDGFNSKKLLWSFNRFISEAEWGQWAHL